MRRIGVLSDTHGTVPKQVYTFFKDCDELWHAGDIGPGVLEELRAWKTVRAVWGNCDSFALHYELEERAFFEVEWVWTFSIPEGATAAVTLPGETESKEYEAGNYTVRR